MPKISVDKLMQDIVYINNQLSGLKMLLEQKKKIMAKYFDVSGHRSITNDEATCYISEKTNIEYDVEELQNHLSKEILNKFIESNYKIKNWNKFTKLCKEHGIKPKELKEFIFVEKKVNQEKLAKLYEKGEVEPAELQGCYTCTVKKSIALRMKNVEKVIPITKAK